MKTKEKAKKYLCNISLTKNGEGFGMCEEFKKDIFIPKNKLAGAFHGDQAWVKIVNEKYWEGEVTGVETRAKEEFTGVIHKNEKIVWLVPHNKKFPVNIEMPQTTPDSVENGQLAVVKIFNWGGAEKLPEATLVRILGNEGENTAEMEAIAAEHGFQNGHDSEVLEQAKSFGKEIDVKEIAGRRDFRKIVTFTIDPADAKDFDDAISIRPLEKGRFEIGVHIADASHYVAPGTALDREAAKRATSVYLVDRVIPMLPELLSNDLCSLLPNKDRLTFSAVFEMDATGKVYSEWFGKSVIHSKARFTYETVQETIETGKGEYLKEIMMLDKIAKRLRKERFEKGSVFLDSVEIKFKLDEKGKPLGIYKKVQKDAHKLVEEFMLLANKKVAEEIFKRGNDAGKIFVYRNHELPDSDKLEDLKEVLVNFGYKIPTKDIGIDPKTLNAIIDAFEGAQERSLIMWIILRSMAKADYSTENIGHFGLAFDSYTHFTSPIRRYPDIMVHRLLQAHLSGKKIKEEKIVYEKLCKHCSEMERKAMNAERESIKYKQVEFVLDKIGKTYTGIITGITDFGMFIEAEEILCEGLVATRDMKDDQYSADKKGHTLTGLKTQKKYHIGDAVKVELVSANLKNRTIDFRLI